MPITVLLVHVDDALQKRVQYALDGVGDGFQLQSSPSLSAAYRALHEETAGVVLLDLTAADASSRLAAMAELRSQGARTPIVALINTDQENVGVEALRLGAQTYLTTSQLDSEVLIRTLEGAMEHVFADAALRESEERFRQVFEEAPIGIALVDQNLRLLRVNATLCQIVGRTESELSELSFRDLGDASEVTALFGREHPPHTLETRLHKKNGATLWTRITASAVRNDRGRVHYAILMIEDITDRRVAAETLRASHNLLHAVIGGTTDAVFVKDGEGRYILLNSAAAAHVGNSADRVIGKRDDELFSAGTAAALKKADNLVRTSGRTETFEEVLEVRGKQRTYLSTKGVYRDEMGNAIGLFGISRDITDRKLEEEKLRRSEASYRGLVEHASYGIYRSTVDDRFVTANRALVSMLGYDSEDELRRLDMGRDVYCEPMDRLRLMDEYHRSNRVEGAEARWKRRDGTRIVVRLSGRPVFAEDGSVEAFEMIVEDVTARRALEMKLRQAQKMEAVGELTGGIAHNLNNILTVVLANIDLVANALPPERMDLRADLEETQVAARRGSALIKRLLDFSRRGRLEVKELDLGALITDLSGMMRRLMPDEVEMKVLLDRRPAVIDGNPEAVEQMLMSLVTNAVDAMLDGGFLRIAVRRAWLDDGYCAAHPWTSPGEYVCVSVSDTGIGMDGATRQRIFEPFFTTKPHAVGAGLGMSMVYGLIKQHSGFVEVSSEPGDGAMVKLYFPCAKGDSSDAVEAMPTVDAAGKLTILVVDDDELIRRQARLALEDHGYTVFEASDGAQGAEVFSEHENEIDLVLTDLVMPKQGGRELYETVGRHGRAVKWVFAGGHSADEVRASGAIDPTAPFLDKPWTETDLLTTVRNVLDEPLR